MPLLMKVTSSSDSADDDNYWLSTYCTLAGYDGWMMIESLSLTVRRPGEEDAGARHAEAIRSRSGVSQDEFRSFLQQLIKSNKTPTSGKSGKAAASAQAGAAAQIQLPPKLKSLAMKDLSALQKHGAQSWTRWSKQRSKEKKDIVEISDVSVTKKFDPATAALFHWAVKKVDPANASSIMFKVEVHQIVGSPFYDEGAQKWGHQPIVSLTLEECYPVSYEADCSGGTDLPTETLSLRVKKGTLAYQEYGEAGMATNDAKDSVVFENKESEEAA